MNRGNLSRRGFLQRSLAAMAVTGLPAWYGREILAAEEEKKDKKTAANDRLVMGAIGIGSPASRGRAIAGDALNTKRVQYVAVCDVDGRHRDRAVADMKNANQEVKAVKDFRELLDNKDIQAVTIATPDHWHALIAIEAMKKGKDVYCEKPLALTVAEGQAIVQVAQKTGRIFQVGSMQRSDGRFRLACELVRNGRIGKISRVETRIGANPTSPSLPEIEAPKELDWDMWLGPAAKVPYMEMKKGNQTFTRCHYEFRWWYEYSGGKMTDWGAHHNDIAQWGLGKDESGPISVMAEGAKPASDGHSYNCHPTFKVTYTYPHDVTLVCSDTQLPGSPDPKSTMVPGGRAGKPRNVNHDNGILFVGEGGKWLFVSRGIITGSDAKLIEEPLGADAKHLYKSDNHMANFLDGVRDRKACICTAEVGHRSVTVCHIGVIALRSGKTLKWDPVKERFDDDEANKMLSREMRAPWKIEV
jgi:predicted dehydrogenase